MRQLVRGELAFSGKKTAVLRDIMRVQTTEKGELFGKTGTGRVRNDPKQVSWFVGWVESKVDGRKQVFACVVRSDGVTGLDVKAMVQKIFESAGSL